MTDRKAIMTRTLADETRGRGKTDPGALLALADSYDRDADKLEVSPDPDLVEWAPLYREHATFLREAANA